MNQTICHLSSLSGTHFSEIQGDVICYNTGMPWYSKYLLFYIEYPIE